MKSIITIALTSVLTACSGASAVLPNPAPQVTAPRPGEGAPSTLSATRCRPFESNFDEFVACRRADGTLNSFGSAQIAWRVRYFVRYQEMPCEEAPTVQEAYVFHAVMDDLAADTDLDGSERTSIRAAMFKGKERCK